MSQEMHIDLTNSNEATEETKNYENLLNRAKSEDLSDISGVGFLYQSGTDRLGRPVIVLCGKWFNATKLNLDKAILYIVKLMDSIVEKDYVMIYFHSQVEYANIPPLAWIKELYYALPRKYKKNLKAFYIVHPTLLTKIMTWWFSSFLAPAIKNKIFTLDGVEHLYAIVARDKLEIPAYITEYDISVNGLHYIDYASPEVARMVGGY